MNDPKPDSPGGAAPQSPKSRLRLWLKRVLFGFGLLVLVLALFHRPLLRWTVDEAARHFALKAGYELEWLLQGSVLSDLSLNRLKVTGSPDALISSIQWGEASFDYSFWNLVRRGPGHFFNRVVLKDAEIVVDLRKQTPQAEPAPSPRRSAPRDFWLRHLELRDVNARIITKEGDILLKDLTLVMIEGVPGVLSIEELTAPQKGLHLAKVKGSTAMEDGWIRFKDLQIMPDVVFRMLGVNVSGLKEGRLPLEVDLRSGESSVEVSGSMAGLGKECLTMDLAFAVNQLRPPEIGRWVALPEGMTWRINQVTGQIQGRPRDPRSLRASLSLNASAIQAGGIQVDQLQSRVTLKDGTMKIEALQARTGENTLDLSGGAVMPDRWSEISRSEAALNFGLNAPALETLFTKTSPLKGGIAGAGMLAVKDGLLAAASLKLQSSGLTAAGVSLSALTAEVESDATEIRVKGVTAMLDAQNGATLAGSIQLAGRQKAVLNLQVQGADLAALFQIKDWLNVYPPAAGALTGSVEARFDVADLREKNFTQLAAEGTVEVSGLQWNQGTLQKASVQFGCKEQVLSVRNLEVVLDDENKLSLEGDLDLRDHQPVNLSWQAGFQQFSSLTAWMPLEGGHTLPPPQAGVLVSRGKASFQMADLRAGNFSGLAATATLAVTGVQWLNAALESAVVDLEIREGKAEARQVSLKISPENQISAQVAVELAAPHAFTAGVNGGLKDLPRISDWLELFNGPAVGSGALSLAWQGRGTLRPLAIEGGGALSMKDLLIEGNPNKYSLAVETRHEGRRAELVRLEARAGGFRLAAAGAVSETGLEMTRLALSSGGVPLAEGSLSVPLALAQMPRPKVPVDPERALKVSLQMQKLKFEELFRALGVKQSPVSGVVDAKAAFAGKLHELRGGVEVNLREVTAPGVKGKLAPASARLQITLVPGRADLQAEVVQKPLQPLVLRASLPLEMARVMADPASLQTVPVKAELSLPESDLSFVSRLVPALTDVRGRVGASVKLEGPLRTPGWRGEINLEVPSAGLAQSQMSIRDLKAKISFVEKKITLEDVSAVLAGGEIRASGGVDVTDLAKPEMDVRVVAKQALIVRDDTMSLRADGDIAIKGPVNGAAVSGRVELVRGRVFKEIEFLPLSLPNHLPPPPPPVKRGASRPSAPPPFDQWKLDVKVVTRDPVRLLGNVLNGGVVVNLHVGGTGGALEVTGRASLENARVQLPFSRLAISRGEVIFTRERPLDPELDLQGDSLVGNYVVTLFAYGPALSPKVRFTSNPPLPEGEIATLLATGSTAGDLTSSEGVAANRAAFLLLSQTYRKVFNKASPRRLDEDPPKLSFSFSPLSTGNTQRAVTATYEISPHLQAVGEISERGTFRGLLHYLVRFR